MTLALVPFAMDQPTSLALAEDALRARLAPGEELRDLFPPLESAIRSARATGGVLREVGVACGVVLWEPSGPLGVALRLLYLSPATSSVERYRAALDLATHFAGPIAFAPGPLSGLSPREEAGLMEGRGFASFGRSEMSFPPGRPVPSVALPREAELRPARSADAAELALLHETAYRDHLDRFLALEDLDPVKDAQRQVNDYFGGRWGELLSPGSTVVALDGRLVAAVIAVRRAGHTLLIDVMTDPAHQGRGFGRAALAGSLGALRDRGESAIVLNVTECNDRALRLYERLGFVRSMGPSLEWYDARRMPVATPVPRSLTRASTPEARPDGTPGAAGPGTIAR